MFPARQITPPDWMTDPVTERLMRIIGGYESPSLSRFVGGCVRNALMGLPVTDIDIATVYRPNEIMEKLGAGGIRYIPTGLEYGTVTALMDGRNFEITTLRKDVDTDGRRAVIAFSDSWEEDALRRDFTINTLLASPDGMVFDPTGKGLLDIDLKRVIFVGNADLRIREDYLRILRFFRFHAAYADGDPDQDAIDACRNHAEAVSQLSRERVTQELLKMLLLPDPNRAFRPMRSAGVLKDLCAAYDPDIMDVLCDAQNRYGSIDVIARLIVLAGAENEKIEQQLVLSNAQKKSLEEQGCVASNLVKPSTKKIREMVYRKGNAQTLQGYFLRQALKRKAPMPDLADIAKYWQAPVFPVKAEALIAGGVSRGPALGQRLKELEEQWIKSDFQTVPRF